jgi:hypothetical protein
VGREKEKRKREKETKIQNWKGKFQKTHQKEWKNIQSGLSLWEESFQSHPSLTVLVSQFGDSGFLGFGFRDWRGDGRDVSGFSTFRTIENPVVLIPTIHAKTQTSPFLFLGIRKRGTDLRGVDVDGNRFRVGPFVIGIRRSWAGGGRRFRRSRGRGVWWAVEVVGRLGGNDLGFLFELSLVHTIVDVDRPFLEGVKRSERLRELGFEVFDPFWESLAKLGE